MKAINLQIENLTCPMGIDMRNPRLTWICDEGKKQTAYQVIVKEGKEVLFDSGKVQSSSMNCILSVPYRSRLHGDVFVTLWNEEDERGEESKAFFEYGLLETWKAKWITGNYAPKKGKRYPVDEFKKEFELDELGQARLYITACGLYEACLNGERVGDFVFAPGSTDYHKRIQYQTYDVTSLLRRGKNELRVSLADGWYRGSSGSKGRLNTYGKQTKFLAQLEVAGKIQLCSDETWAWSNDGALLFADLKDGEIVDANKTPSCEKKSKVVSFQANLTSSNNVFVKEHETFKPEEIVVTPTGKKVLKFAQNLCGYVSFQVKAHKGQTVKLRLGEMLDRDGEFTQKNIQCIHHGKPSPLQEITYFCKEGLNEYKTKFFYGGFQYVLVETDIPFEKDDFTQIAVYSDFRETSSFTSSNELLNQFYRATKWSLKSNSVDIPSDCPTRERMGWTGDSQVFFNTASYLMDYASFARKHVRDIYDRQWKDGKLPQIAPFANEDWFMASMNGSVGWACAGVYIPLRYYYKYGDKRILEQNFDGMLRYAQFMMKRQGRAKGIYSIYAKPLHLSKENARFGVNSGQSYGEWAEPNDVCSFVWTDFAAPHPEESTAYTYYTLQKVLEVARILDRHDEILKTIEERSEGAKRAYQEMVTKRQFTIDTDRQAKLVRPLYMGLLDEKQTEFAKDRLVKALDHYGWRLGTGFLSTPFILYVLSEIDVKYAYKLLENEELPGWLAMPKAGACTIWEAWEGNNTSDAGIASLNHYSKGAVCEWLFDSMCGIVVTGENQFTLAPKVGGMFMFAEASYESVYGKIESKWKREGDKVVYTFAVPSNCTAELVLPGMERQILNAGEHRFEITLA